MQIKDWLYIKRPPISLGEQNLSCSFVYMLAEKGLPKESYWVGKCTGELIMALNNGKK